MSGLPRGWALAQLGEIVEHIPNIKPEEHPEQEFGYLDISSIDNTSFKVADVKRIKGKDAPSRARRPIQVGDVLFSNVRTYLRNIALVLPGTSADVCSTGFTVLRSNAAVDPVYLFRYVLTDAFIDQVTPQQTGTHYPATSDRVVMSEKLPLPPLNEQRRIVAKLEELLTRVDASQQRLAKIPVILKRFRQAVLAAACSGRLTADWREEKGFGEGEELPEGWVYSDILPLLSTKRKGLKTGPFGSMLKKHEHQQCGIPVLGIENIGYMQFIPGSKIHITTEKAEELREFDARPGDVLISRSGTVGEVCVVPKEFPEARISTNIMRVVLSEKRILPIFFCYLFNGAPSVLAQVTELCKGSTRDFLNQSILKEISFPLPTFPEQQEIVRRVESLFTLADQLEARYKSAKAHVDKLTQSILAKAFRGELVPQDPNDEPAAVLLERIRSGWVKPIPLTRPTPQVMSARASRGMKPEPLPLAAEPALPYGPNIPQRILDAMQPGRDYSRADLIVASGVSEAEWTWAIRQLREEGAVSQTGERRGARYRRK